MKCLAVVAAAIFLGHGPGDAKGSGGHSSSAQRSTGGSHSVKGHVKKDGTYVAPSHATNPNKSRSDNWSSKGQVNPYTGKEGTKDPLTGK